MPASYHTRCYYYHHYNFYYNYYHTVSYISYGKSGHQHTQSISQELLQELAPELAAAGAKNLSPSRTSVRHSWSLSILIHGACNRYYYYVYHVS
jgi:hypothetical protein